MERIKEALEKAREQREFGTNGTPTPLGRDAASGSKLGKDRILEREPFKRYSPVDQQKLLETGRVVNVGVGETLQFAGDKDSYVHYLLSGAVVLESGQNTTTVSAEQDLAQRPLDAAGVKAHTIVAASDAEVFRVPHAALPVDGDGQDVTPIPTTAYTETYSGQQLAALVEQINSENVMLDNEHGAAAAADLETAPGADASAVSLSELSASADSLLADLEMSRDADTPDLRETDYVPAVDDELGNFTRELELRFRRYVEKVKAEERARYEAQLQSHAERLQKLAERQVRSTLAAQRERYKNVYADKERRLRERYNNLRDFANKIARQKAAVYVARRQISEKLQMVEQIHIELAQLGSQLNHQLDDLDDLMPSANTGTDPT